MLELREIKIEDKKWIDSAFESADHMGCENAFGTMFVWRNLYNLKICQKDGFLFRRYGKTKKYYAFPIGDGNIKTAFEILIEQTRNDQEPFCMMGITEKMISIIEKLFPGKFEFTPLPEHSDYVYKSSNLALLEGKKFHSKRNHISKFEKAYNWSYEKVSERNLDDCREVAKEWCKKHGMCSDKDTSGEVCALKLTFENFNDLGFVGGLIKVSGRPIAFSIGGRINDETFAVHFEKADTEYVGVYPMINREFVKNEVLGYKYVNREEDLGISGLKKAKLSYHPDIILKKFKAELKN